MLNGFQPSLVLVLTDRLVRRVEQDLLAVINPVEQDRQIGQPQWLKSNARILQHLPTTISLTLNRLPQPVEQGNTWMDAQDLFHAAVVRDEVGVWS